jgi:hypothetical protein
MHVEYEPICEAERRLGLGYVNIAEHGVKAHPGRMVSDTTALLLFDRPRSGEMTVALWDMSSNQAITSETLPFGVGMLWDWDWRAEAVEKAFQRLVPELFGNDDLGDKLAP